MYENYTKILVIEDDSYINKLLCDMLNCSGYDTKSAYSGTEGLIYLEKEVWDMVLLDLMLPGMSGERVLEEIRKTKSMPVIIISAREGTDIKVETLRVGADDFISKPFDIEEVSARIDSHLRRYKQFSPISQHNILTHREIYLNKDTREVFVKENLVDLTHRKFDILKLFMTYPKKVFTKANLFESVWQNGYLGDDNTINVHMSNLRTKLIKAGINGEYIQTVWGIGYKLVD
ncbi:response regulator transcription factor [Clostridium niameyense]|uniref:response regulator transcription factor n=1 Tax=Clostridium niameyense TaxID=1622073 RepID=UPI00067E8833|nr:response regulator transcription factor [Clostridium niameyense]